MTNSEQLELEKLIGTSQNQSTPPTTRRTTGSGSPPKGGNQTSVAVRPERGVPVVRFWTPAGPSGPRPEPRPRWSRAAGRAFVPGSADEWKDQLRASCVEALLRDPARAAADALGDPTGLPVTAVPFAVELELVFARPHRHYAARAGRDRARPADGTLLKPSAPRWHVQVPDWDNLAKAACDALSRWHDLPPLLWLNDSQVVDARVRKRWSEVEDDALGCGSGCWFEARILGAAVLP